MNLLEHLRAKASEAIFDAYISYTDKNEYTLAKDNATHYRTGNGTEVVIPPEKIRSYSTIQNAAKKNEQRLLDAIGSENVLFKKFPSGRMEATHISHMKNNERVTLNDHFDVDRNTTDYVLDYTDLGLAIGSFKLRSKSNLEFVKSGNKLLPYGHVNHKLHKEKYDFNDGSAYELITTPLEKSEKAKPYKVKSEWNSHPIGVIHIKDNNLLDASELEWITP